MEFPLQTVGQALEKAPLDGPARGFDNMQPTSSDSLIADVHRSMSMLSSRDRSVLFSRLGFETQEESLAKVAGRYGLTRERVRQIQDKAIAKIIEESSWCKNLSEKIWSFLKEKDVLLTLERLEALDPWFKGVSHHQTFLKNLTKVRAFHPHIKDLHLIKSDSLAFFSPIEQEVWEEKISVAQEALESAVDRELTKAEARRMVEELLPEAPKPLRSQLWEESSKLCHFSRRQGSVEVLVGYGRGAEEMVRSVLFDSPDPLHYKVIIDHVNDKYDKILKEGVVRHVAYKAGLLFSSGVYGLSHHIPLTEQEQIYVSTEIERLVPADSTKQWHAEELMTELENRKIPLAGKLDSYLLDIVLRKSNLLESHNRMIWSRPQASEKKSRIKLRDAVISVIAEAGGPLTTQEVKSRVAKLRGISKRFQIHPKPPLIKVDSGLWGIEGRDLPSKQ